MPLALLRVAVGPAFEYPCGSELRQTFCGRGLGNADASGEVVEPARTEQGLANQKQRNAIADDVEGIDDGAIVECPTPAIPKSTSHSTTIAKLACRCASQRLRSADYSLEQSGYP